MGRPSSAKLHHKQSFRLSFPTEQGTAPRMRYGLFTLFALALGVSACGAPQAPAGGPEHCEHCKQGEPCEHCKTGEPCDCKHGEKKDDHGIKGPVGDFHGVLSPVYHMNKGADRVTKACDQVAAMKEKAAAVEAGAAPEGAKADDYKAAAKTLSSAVEGFGAACAAAGRADVDAKLEALHDAFHKLIEVPGVMPHHDEHGGHHGPPPPPPGGPGAPPPPPPGSGAPGAPPPPKP